MMHKARLIGLSAGKSHPLIAFLAKRLFGERVGIGHCQVHRVNRRVRIVHADQTPDLLIGFGWTVPLTEAALLQEDGASRYGADRR
jgi:hypothetical protein